MEKQYFLFDFDGVLVDSMETWAGVHINALIKGGIAVPENFVETITPLGNIKASKYTIDLGLDITLEEYLENISKELYFEYTTNIKLKPNVKEYLTKLKNEGNTLCVLTASPHLYVDDCLKKHGIFDLFDFVWTVDDLKLTKAQPEIFVLAAEKLGADVCDCTMFDDNIIAITNAKAAELKTVAVYDNTSLSVKTKMQEIADKYINSFEEML